MAEPHEWVTPSVPCFAVVGKVNMGKSAVLATLLEEDDDRIIRISPEPGETTRCQRLSLVLDGVERLRFIDTPGFQQPIEALRAMFRDGCEMPVRHHHDFAIPGEDDGTLLLMPAWVPGRYIGVKLATVVPGNGRRGLPAIMASYLLSEGLFQDRLRASGADLVTDPLGTHTGITRLISNRFQRAGAEFSGMRGR